MTYSISDLEAEERDLVLEQFDHADAWRLGARIAVDALARSLPVCLDIRRPGLILFRASLVGVTPDQETWIAKKAAVTLRMEASSALVGARFAAQAFDPASIAWLDHETYAPTGGSVPIRIRGVGVVAAVTISGGLDSEEDHALVVNGLRAHLAQYQR